ncbi:hypothetical protein BD626DRAFT_405068 [Schizophyllum amplum]|uniref:Actin cortical patch SUR7/pH-response regulator pali n=1 Tax=Schizophyllum amplum TaxID=97359 RepID=A0A550CB28_9AGAR|nr:hypothetical protein BD626DRAFT_405068 [Auriculariopsis ampla]
MFSVVSPLLTFAAFVLLLLVSLSTPIIKSIHIFSVTSDVTTSIFNTDVGVSGYADFGVWGYCTSDITVSGVSGYEDTISKGTTAALVLHPIACGLTFLAFLVSLLMVFRARVEGTARFASICSLVWGILAAILTTAVFLIDIIFVAIVRNKVRDESDNEVDLHFDNAIWMVLGAAVALWLSLIGGCCGVCACGR